MKKFLKIAILTISGVMLIVALSTFRPISVDENQVEKALEYCKKNGYNTEFCILVDYSQSTWKKRMVIWDFNKQQTIYCCKCAHGNTNPTATEATIESFSNQSGSHKSSLGKYRIGRKRKINSADGQFDVSMFNIPCYELHGLDKSNSNAYKRGILLHPSPGMSSWLPLPILPFNSFGCFSVPMSSFEVISKYISGSSKPVLLIAYFNEQTLFAGFFKNKEVNLQTIKNNKYGKSKEKTVIIDKQGHLYFE